TVELCRMFRGGIIHCCFRNDPTSLFNTQLGWTRFSDSADTAPIEEIAALDLPVYWASTYSRLNEETLAIVQQYDHVYLAGVFTDISIAATALDLFDHKIPVSVVTDCVATLHGVDVQSAALKSLDHALGRKHIVNSKVLI
ncbi:MAG TPA: isochorismatase family protein, partial [Candidatus Saccharimonadales bacterium]|nr:isochorismatase family protein [Candidatus Saccharimonadales bacterium]